MAGNLEDELRRYLQTWNSEVIKRVKESVDVVAQETMEEIKNKISFNEPTGKYRKAFRLKKSFESSFDKRITWHVAAPYYRLTHLLEFGHAKKGGGRTRAFPHIKYGEELAKRRLVELIEQDIREASR